MIIFRMNSFSNQKCMINSFISKFEIQMKEIIRNFKSNLLHFLLTQLTHQIRNIRTSRSVFFISQQINVVENTVSDKFSFISFNPSCIQLFQLCLTLIVFIEIATLQSNSSVCFIYMNSEF